jgi:glycosyltransferase involved in cell wall biosynthesis
MARIARSVLCISEWTRADFARHFPTYESDRLHVLTLGSDAALDVGPNEDAFARAIFDGEPYAVYCATLDRRKNHQILYRAMREMVRRDLPGNLVFVGMIGSGVADLVNAMRNDSLVKGRIAHVSNCDDMHLAALYRQARFAVYPSMYEGWGLGVTEALAHGKRSVVASGSSLSEAAFGTAYEVHPLVTAQWVDAMAERFHDADVTTEIELPTWADTAAQLIDLVSAR